jgi:AraC-like DNA-binding protein
MQIQYEANGLVSLREIRDATSQPLPHSHNEIEILLLERGLGTWLMGGEIMTFKPRRLVAFWALKPHQLVKSAKNTVINCLTIPLGVFNSWAPPEDISRRLRSGELLIEPGDGMFESDRRSFARWHKDLKGSERQRQKLALLEIKARLGRLALSVGEGLPIPGPSRPDTVNPGYFDKVSKIADIVSRRFTQDISVPQIASEVGMHPSSATKMFKKACGMNLIHYLTQHRILHAQRLLATGDMKIIDVALASGYRSASRFYASFKEFCGSSPQEFRSSFDLRKVPLERPSGTWRIGRSRAPRKRPLPSQA